MTKIDNDDRFRAFGRVVAREIPKEDLERISGGIEDASMTSTNTWTEQGDDKDTDCEGSLELECVTVPTL